MDNTKLFALYEFGESFLANGLGLVLFPILLYEFGINIYTYALIIGFSNSLALLLNVYILKTPSFVIKRLFIFSLATFFAGFGLLISSKYMFAIFFGIFSIIHMQGLLFYQISILETEDLKLSSSFSSILGYLGYFLAILLMFFVKSHKILILIGIFLYIFCAFIFYKFSNKSIFLKAQNLKLLKDKVFLKYAISLISLSVAPQFFNNSMTMYLKTYLNMPNKNIYILMFIGLLCAIASSYILSKIWKKEDFGFYITAFFWILVYIIGCLVFFIHIKYPFLYGTILALLGGFATGFFWTFFKAITALKFMDQDIALRISFIYGLSSALGPMLFFLFSFISPLASFLSILIVLLLALIGYKMDTR